MGLLDEKTLGQKLSKLKLSDLVCMTKEEGVIHERLVLNGDKTPEEVYGKDVLEMVDRRFREEMILEELR